MSKRQPSGVAAYLRRFFTSWVAADPDPQYSALDRADGVDRFPDPLTDPAASRQPAGEARNQALTAESRNQISGFDPHQVWAEAGQTERAGPGRDPGRGWT